jgi:hypothetical protein
MPGKGLSAGFNKAKKVRFAFWEGLWQHKWRGAGARQGRDNVGLAGGLEMASVAGWGGRNT